MKASMKLFVMMGFIFALGAQAKAAYTCRSVDDNAEIRIVNTTAAQKGRSPSTQMIISDPYEQMGQQTRAIFRIEDGNLNQKGADFQATVSDRSFVQSSQEPRMAGLNLGELKQIFFSIDLSFHLTSKHGSIFAAQATYLTSGGEALVQDFDCLRPE